VRRRRRRRSRQTALDRTEELGPKESFVQLDVCIIAPGLRERVRPQRTRQALRERVSKFAEMKHRRTCSRFQGVSKRARLSIPDLAHYGSTKTSKES
jgi:hypothetical protein